MDSALPHLLDRPMFVIEGMAGVAVVSGIPKGPKFPDSNCVARLHRPRKNEVSF
jgi:hypothetical protein